METQDNQPQQQMSPDGQVSFPQPRQPEGGSNTIKIVIALVGVIAITIVGGWLIMNSNNDQPSLVTPTPAAGGLAVFETPEPAATPDPEPLETPEPVAKEDVRIQVLNGTGVAGGAGFLKAELEKNGFSDITVGNADNQNQTQTTVTYSRELSQVIADEITAMLEELYEDVRTRRATVAGGFDVSITTGPRVTSQ